MKKLFLTLGALSIVAGAWAETYDNLFPAPVEPGEYFTDAYFQKNFCFTNTELTSENVGATLIPSEKNLAKLGGAANMGAKWIENNINYTTNPEYQDGIIVLGGGFAYSGGYLEAGYTTMRSAMSILDFGGEIGKTLLINGMNSELDKYLKANFKDDFNLSDDFELNKANALINSNCQLFWILDKAIADAKLNEGATAGTMRIRVELNIYKPADTDIFGMVARYNNAGKDWLGTNAVPVNSKSFRQYENDFVAGATDAGEVVAGSWNPYRWMVYEFDVPRGETTEESGILAYSHIKMQLQGGSINNGAIMIRNLKVYFAPENVFENYKDDAIKEDTARITWLDFTPKAAPEVKSIVLSHNQNNDFELSGSETAELSFEVTPSDYDPATVFSVELADDDHNYVVASEIKDGKFTVTIDEAATKNTVKISVKAGEVSSNEVELTHYAAPKSVKLSGDEVADNAISLAVDASKVTLPATVVCVNSTETDAFQSFTLDASENNIATIQLNSDGTAVEITPKAKGSTEFTLTPVLAGASKAQGTRAAVEGTKYTVTIGSTGVEVLNQATGEVEYYNLQGVKVANPEKGIYIKKQGDKTSKVVL